MSCWGVIAISLIIESGNLLPALKDLHTITGVKAAVFDTDFSEACAYPENHSPFCRSLRACAEGEERCRNCDRTAQIRIKESGGDSLIYTCHVGLQEAITPIRDETGVIGYLMAGQLVSGSKPIDTLWKETRRKCDSFMDADALEQDFYRLPRVTNEQVDAFAGIMKACASYIGLKGFVKARRQADFLQIDNYIDDNLSGELTAANLCSIFFISRNALFKLIRDETGLTLGQYVNKKRLNYAKHLLKTADDNILRVSELCGVDFNYFSRLFKKEFGQSPREYRKRLVRPA